MVKIPVRGILAPIVKELKEAGIKIVLHVIGFDVSDAERDQLRCIAKAGGGTYYTADTARQFSKAVWKIVDKDEHKGSYLKIVAVKNGKPFGAMVDVFPAGEEAYIAYGLTPKEFRLLPGFYDIRVKDREVPGEPTVWIRKVEIEPGKKIKRNAEFVVGQIMVIALMNGQSVSVEVDVFPAGEEEYIVWGHTPKGFRLVPGIYDIRVRDRSVPQEAAVWVRGVEVKAGGKVKVEAKF